MALKRTATIGRGINVGLGVVAVGLIVGGISYLVTDNPSRNGIVRAGSPTPGTVTIPAVTNTTPGVPTISVPPGAPNSLFQGTTPPPATVPLGVADCPTAAAANVLPTATVTLTLQDETTGFSQHCYYASAGTSLSLDVHNNVVNATTGLPEYQAFSLSSSTSPGFGKAAGNTGAVLANPAGALFDSPTILDATPVELTVGPLLAGEYYLELTTLPATPPAVLIVS